MRKRHHTAHYSASDIQKYLRGEMSAAEMHTLERAALEDPFLADAIEGLAFHGGQVSDSGLQQDLAQLQERLTSRTNARRRQHPFFLRPVSLAAAVLLLLGIGYSYFIFFTARKPRMTPSAHVAYTA
ncbi:MAG TPA: hypothetical protein VKU83_05445, partial [Puia sp.]|nr:hypothetical protein [Puia sp.]